jgi:hypothetical protein
MQRSKAREGDRKREKTNEETKRKSGRAEIERIITAAIRVFSRRRFEFRNSSWAGCFVTAAARYTSELSSNEREVDASTSTPSSSLSSISLVELDPTYVAP